MSDQPIIHVCQSSYGRFVELDEHKRVIRLLASAAKRYLQVTQSHPDRDNYKQAKYLQDAIKEALETESK